MKVTLLGVAVATLLLCCCGIQAAPLRKLTRSNHGGEAPHLQPPRFREALEQKTGASNDFISKALTWVKTTASNVVKNVVKTMSNVPGGVQVLETATQVTDTFLNIARGNQPLSPAFHDVCTSWFKKTIVAIPGSPGRQNCVAEAGRASTIDGFCSAAGIATDPCAPYSVEKEECKLMANTMNLKGLDMTSVYNNLKKHVLAPNGNLIHCVRDPSIVKVLSPPQLQELRAATCLKEATDQPCPFVTETANTCGRFAGLGFIASQASYYWQFRRRAGNSADDPIQERPEDRIAYDNIFTQNSAGQWHFKGQDRFILTSRTPQVWRREVPAFPNKIRADVAGFGLYIRERDTDTTSNFFLALGFEGIDLVTNQRIAIFAVKGSSSFSNWMTNLAFLATDTVSPQVPIDSACADNPGTDSTCPKIHRGFWECLNWMDSQSAGNIATPNAEATSMVTWLRQQQANNARIIFTGHSLGGALAVDSARRWAHDSQRDCLITFGQPAVGNRKYNELLFKDQRIKYLRFSNLNDWTPSVLTFSGIATGTGAVSLEQLTDHLFKNQNEKTWKAHEEAQSFLHPTHKEHVEYYDGSYCAETPWSFKCHDMCNYGANLFRVHPNGVARSVATMNSNPAAATVEEGVMSTLGPNTACLDLKYRQPEAGPCGECRGCIETATSATAMTCESKCADASCSGCRTCVLGGGGKACAERC